MEQSVKKLPIYPDARKVMEEDALRLFPDECCGFLYGRDETEREIIFAQPVHNAKEGDKRRRFEITPKDYLRAENYAIEHDLTLVGIYHSHPLHPAIASEHDRAVAMPWFSYVILSVFPEEIKDTKSWQLNAERQFVEESLRFASIIPIKSN
jgi:proteasome lid subunit RPN8/RPN11